MMFYSAILFLMLNCLFGQINMADSTVKVIGNWNVMDSQSYKITHDSYNIVGSDTTDRYILEYVVDVTIIDATPESYTIEWHYRNYSVETEISYIREILSVADEMKILIRTNEKGAFQEVLNWEDVYIYLKDATDDLKYKFKKYEELSVIIDEMLMSFSSKEKIEAEAIDEIKLFYQYHGKQYYWNSDYEQNRMILTELSGNEIETYHSIWLDQLEPKPGHFRIQSYESLTFDQLSLLIEQKKLEKASELDLDVSEIEHVGVIDYEVFGGSWIHQWGWVMNSWISKESNIDGVTYIELLDIEIL